MHTVGATALSSTCMCRFRLLAFGAKAKAKTWKSQKSHVTLSPVPGTGVVFTFDSFTGVTNWSNPLKIKKKQ